MKYYIGVDPGNSGGIALLNDKDDLRIKEYRNNILVNLLYKLRNEDVMVFIEDAKDAVRTPFGQKFINVKSYYVQGRNVGTPEGIIMAYKRIYGMKYKTFEPKKWQTYLDLIGKEKEATAEMMVDVLDLDEKFFLTQRGRLMDGCSDAAAIAYYGRARYGRKKK